MQGVFNPYVDRCPHHDLPEAPTIRRKNLTICLQRAVDLGVETVWVARDLGYRGGRRTGLALTDEANLESFSRLYRGVPLRKATRGPTVAERTAAMVWEIIGNFDKPIFPWNVFPLHPHEDGKPLTNRCHTRVERMSMRPLLVSLLELLRPRLIVAIGKDALNGLQELGIASSPVRHPSYGGKADFVSGLAALYGKSAIQERRAQEELRFD